MDEAFGFVVRNLGSRWILWGREAAKTSLLWGVEEEGRARAISIPASWLETFLGMPSTKQSGVREWAAVLSWAMQAGDMEHVRGGGQRTAANQWLSAAA